MEGAHRRIEQTGRALHSRLKSERGPNMHALCKNMQGVLKLIKKKKDQGRSGPPGRVGPAAV